MDDTERRLEDLEIKVSYMEALVQELDLLVRQATDKLLAVEAEVTTMRQASEQDRLSGSALEKPPHY